MPKASNPAAAILNFFRKQPLPVAELVLNLCRGEVHERKAAAEKVRQGQEKSAKARAKEQAEGRAVTLPKPKPAHKKPGRKPGRKPKPQQQELLDPSDIDQGELAEAEVL